MIFKWTRKSAPRPPRAEPSTRHRVATDTVAEALRLAPPDAEAEVRKELALALYARGILGFGKARELCGLTKWQFEELLGRRKVIRPYDEDDLAVDLAYARRSQ
jgi:predicted HTH domain antitoxin